MKLIIKDDYEGMCAWAAQHIADAINNHKEKSADIYEMTLSERV